MGANTCLVCGGLFEQTGADSKNIYHKCPYCGNTVSTPVKEDEANLVFEMEKRELLGRIRSGFVDYRVTQWDQLYSDLVDFTNRYDQLSNDLQFQMAIIACMTKGFNIMDTEKYTQCKNLFKITDKMYKQQLKDLKQKAEDPSLSETIEEYKQYRVKYIRLRNQYRNTKLAWKIVFAILKKAVPIIK